MRFQEGLCHTCIYMYMYIHVHVYRELQCTSSLNIYVFFPDLTSWEVYSIALGQPMTQDILHVHVHVYIYILCRHLLSFDYKYSYTIEQTCTMYMFAHMQHVLKFGYNLVHTTRAAIDVLTLLGTDMVLAGVLPFIAVPPSGSRPG